MDNPPVQLEGVAHFLCWAFHLANSAPARWRQRARGIFMEEVHASNSLSSSKLATPAQKDLGAVNNSVWLRDFHFAGPGSLLPQGPARGCLPHPLWRGAPHPPHPPCFTFCSLPASFLSISLFFVCASPSPPLPVPPMQHTKRVSPSASRIHWLLSATAWAEPLCWLARGWTLCLLRDSS